MTSTPNTATRRPTSKQDFDQVIADLAKDVARLDSGALAALRRGALVGAGAPAFWTLLARHDLSAVRRDIDGWAAVMQGMALMTPRGRDQNRPPAHDPRMPLGRALANGGTTEREGPSSPPLFSELRLARLMASKGMIRQDLALRACRMFASHEVRINWSQMARLILDGDEYTARRIARDYYGTLDRRVRQDQEKSTDNAAG